MMLQLGDGQCRRLLVEVDGKSPEAGKVPSAQNQDPMRCVLSPPDNGDMLTIQMSNLSLAIARYAQIRGGLRKRKISGGRSGMFVMRMNRVRRALFSTGARMLKGLYQRMADKGMLRGLLPKKLQPRVVAFHTSRYQDLYKLMVNGREIGRYNDRNEEWQIRPPFRLFVDESRLPRPERRRPQLPPPARDGSIAQK